MASTAPGIVIDYLHGFCPVQAGGRINGKDFYFRARGSKWTLYVGGNAILSPEFTYSEPYGETFEAGWMSEGEAIVFIDRGATAYLKHLKASSNGN